MNLAMDSTKLPRLQVRNRIAFCRVRVNSLTGTNLQCSSVPVHGASEEKAFKQPQLTLYKALTPKARLNRNERLSEAFLSLEIFLAPYNPVLETQIASFKQASQIKGHCCPYDT